MDQYLPYLLFAVGLVLIIKGSDWFIDGAIWIAKIFHISDIVIGATLVSLCTTLPEFMVSFTAVLGAEPNTEISLSNALGSIAFNTGFILALVVILVQPKWTERKNFQLNGKILFFSLLSVFIIGSIFGQIPRWMGYLLLGGLVLYIIHMLKSSRNGFGETVPTPLKTTPMLWVKNLSFLVVGITLTFFGARLLVEQGEIIARMLGVPQMVIGITLTALGTSLPELMTSITAIVKKRHNISIGNIIGADILNVLFVMGASSSVSALPAGGIWMKLHFPFVLGICFFTLAFSYTDRERFSRKNGIMIFALYALYIFFTVNIT